jgi:glycosyltransferase 2 family protein
VRRVIIIIASVAFGALLTWFAFRGTDWPAVGRSISRVDPPWLVAAGALLVLAEFIRARRFGLIVRTTMQAGYRQLCASVLIGNLFQMVVPFRAGSFARAIVLSRLTRTPVSGCYGAVVLDRVPELAILALFALAALMGLPDNPEFLIEADVLDTQEDVIVPGGLVQSTAGVIAVMLSLRLGMLAALFIKKDLALRLIGAIIGLVSTRAAARAQRLLGYFADSLAIMRSGALIVQALGLTALYWTLFALAHTCILRAFGYIPPWYAPLLLTILTAVALVVHGAPGYIGQFHLAIVMSLVIAMPAIPSAELKAIAIVGHAVFLIVITLLGVGILVAERGKLFAIPAIVHPLKEAKEKK